MKWLPRAVCVTGAVGASLAGAVHGQWARTYGATPPGERLFDLRRAADGSLLAAGSTLALGTSLGGLVLRLDGASGQVLSQGIVGHPSVGVPFVVDGAALAADGGATFLGRFVLDLFVKHDAWLVRTDAAGQPLWWRGFTRPGLGRHFLFDAVEAPSGAWYAVGTRGLVDEPPQAGWVVRLSASGAVDWEQEYAGGELDHLQAVAATSDSGVVAVGWTTSAGAGSDDAWVLKLDRSGVVQWQRVFGAGDGDRAAAVAELPTGGYAVAGNTLGFSSSGYAPWVARLDAGGAVLGMWVVDGVWGDLGAVAATRRGFVALGRVGETGFPTNDLWAVELALDGSVRWQRAYEGSSGDFGSAIEVLGGDGLALGGVSGWGFPVEDFLVVRTGPLGVLPGCEIVRDTSFALLAPAVREQPGVAVRQPVASLDLPLGMFRGDGVVVTADPCF